MRNELCKMKFLVLLLCLYCVAAVPSKEFHNWKTQHEGRIIGGSIARSGQFPFAAAIYMTTADGNYFCGGALLTNQWVLTAGQCADGAIMFDIHLGSDTLDGNSPYAVKVSSDTYSLHPEYDYETLNNDLALIYLRVPVEFSDYLKPVDFLPVAPLSTSSSSMAIGWGQISNDESGLVNELRYVSVTTLSNEECRVFYGNQITDGMVCVGGNFNEGTCLGDSGSPLVQTMGTGHTVVVGVSSFISQNGCETPEPSGFARIYPYNDWIRSVTGKE